MRTRIRAGFTLIELMVAMALTLFIMIILTQAFVTSLDTFTNMKGIGDMQQNLRVAEVLLRDDLSQDHFGGKRRLSDTTATGSSALAAQPPQAGFFAVRRSSALGSAAYTLEGTDASGLPSYRATDHMIYMTVKRKGNQQQNFFSTALVGDPAVLTAFFGQKTAYNLDPIAELPFATWAPQYTGGNTAFYASQWAEVFYYLVRTGSTEEPINPSSVLGTPTFGLYRAQFVMVPDGTNVSALYANGLTLDQSTFAPMSCGPGATQTRFFSPADAAGGLRMAPSIAAFPASNRFAPGNAAVTLVCPNVVSFQVQAMQLGSTAFDDMSAASLNTPFFYDTANLNGGGLFTSNGLKAIQVTLRVFDNKTRQTRQVTVVQDL